MSSMKTKKLQEKLQEGSMVAWQLCLRPVILSDVVVEFDPCLLPVPEANHIPIAVSKREVQ